MKCFYHSADLDGHCSGALIKLKHPECEMIGINYGDKFPWNSIKFGEKIFMVDFSLQPFEDMVTLNKTCNLVWIDHHKSAIEEAHKVGFLAYEQVLENGIGACALVWNYLHPDEEIPYPIQILAEYDVWNHSDSNTLPFQFGIRMYHTVPNEQGMDFWIGLLGEEENPEIAEQILVQGKTILNYVAQDNQKYISACAFDTEIDGLRCIAVNKMLTNSQVFDSVWDPDKYDAMLTFGWRKGQWTVSLYTDKSNIDVSVIAKNRGGGGHKGAAGFQAKELPFKIV